MTSDVFKLSSATPSGDVLGRILESAELRQRHSPVLTSFADCLTQEVRSTFGSRRVRVWEVGPDDPPRLVARCADRDDGSHNADSRDNEATVPHAELVTAIRELPAGGVRHVSETMPSVSAAEASRGAQNGESSSVRHLLAAADVADGLRLVLDIAQPLQEHCPTVVRDLADVLADLHRRRMVSEIVQQAKTESRTQLFISLLHADLDDVRVMNTLATDAAELLGCRRIAVFKRPGSGRWQIAAATGVAAPDPRSDASRQLSRIMDDAERHGHVTLRLLDADGRSLANPGSEVSPATSNSGGNTAVLSRPLTANGEWKSARYAVLFEFTSPRPDNMQLHRVGRVVQSSASALSNCDARFQATLAGKLSRSVRSLLRPGGLFGLVACLVAAGLLWFWQVELTIEATGTLVPRNRAFVFAPDDGVVEAIHVEDGVAVSAGALLVEFSNDDLLLRRETVEGELAAARARLAAIDSMRGDRSANQNNLLSAEQAELNEQVRSLEKQATLLEARQRQLQITARIGGVVRGERLRETLLRRPVHRGQLLFQIADPQGEWELDLRIDEGDVRHVVSAVHGQSKPLRVTFSLETSPETRRETQLAELSNAADVDEFGRVTTRATAAFPHAVSQSPGQSDEMRPGAGVVAAIQCGRQSAGFVWFRKVIEFVQRQRMW